MEKLNPLSKLAKRKLNWKSIRRWYTWKPVIILLLIFFFPVGLYLMWKFSTWSKRKKWTITAVVSIFWGLALWGGYNQPPSISYDNVKNAKVSTDNKQFEIIGDVSSMKAVTLTADGKKLEITKVSEFSYTAPLKEGDNTITLEATNDNGTTVEKILIHRTTQAEFTARAEAEKFAEELKAQKEKRSEAKAKQDAEAAKQSKEDETKKKSLSNNEKKDENKGFFSWLNFSWNIDWLFGNSPEQKAKKAQEQKAKEQEKKAQERAKAKSEAEKRAQEKARSEEEARKKAEQANTISEDEIMFTLIDATKDNVKKVLKAPSSAEFPGSWLDPGDGWSKTQINKSTVRLYSYVDSQNGFGAMLRSHFSMTWCKQNSVYKVTQFVFDGTTYVNKECGQ